MYCSKLRLPYTEVMPNYIIQQKITPLVNRYAIYAADANGQQGAMVAFTEQKRFAFKEMFTMYANEDKQQVLFTMQARQVLDFGARYDIRDAEGNALGVIGKNFKSSLLRSTWHMYRTGQEDAPAIVAQERSKPLAIIRRIWELLPYISDIPFFVKYHFDFTDPATEKIVASYEKQTTFRDHYLLKVSDEAAAMFDWRVYVSLGVAMDAMQSR